MMFAAMLKDAWRQTRDQWIQWVLYAGIVLILIGVAVLPIDSLSGVLTNHPAQPGVVTTPDDNKQILWTAFKYIVASGLAGWVGLIIALIMTAAQIPSMLRPGGVDLVASYPHPRWQLLLARYLGGVVFIAWYTSLLIIGMYLVVGLRGGGWEWPFLMAIPATVGAFAVLYSISTLLGVLFRNPVMSILGTLAIWLVIFLLRLGMTFCLSNALQYYAISEPKIYEFAKMDAESRIKMKTDPKTGKPVEGSAEASIQKREDIVATARSWETAGNVFYALSTPFPNMDLFGLIYGQISTTDALKAKQDKEKQEMDSAIERYKTAADTSDESKQIVGKLEELSDRIRPSYARDGVVTALFTLGVLGLAMWRFSRLDF